MLFWGLVILAAVLASEAFLRLPVLDRIARVSATAKKAGRVLKSARISDHWKERVLPAYALRMGAGSITFFLLLCAALVPVLIAGLLYPPGLLAWSEALMRPLVILVLCVVSLGSLTYADMPFVLAPNLWTRLSSRGQKPGRKAERAHGDGIEVDTQSPEALDEVYWRLFDGAAYIGADGLAPHRPDDEIVSGYRDLIRLVLRKTGKTRYVSKNNNNILRLGTLAAEMPQAQFLVPLREPLVHAASLLNQHERFRNCDPFVRDYMTWLGHHEFGATHRPFLFEGRPEGDPATLDYWLRIWLAAYRALDEAEAAHENVLFVPYEALSGDPAIWQAVARKIGIEPRPASELKVVRDKAPGAHDPALAAEAAALHARLKARGLARLGLAS